MNSSLNPLKRVSGVSISGNSFSGYLTEQVSIPSNGSVVFLYGYDVSKRLANSIRVSIPSNGSVVFLWRPDAKSEEENDYEVSIPSNGSVVFLWLLGISQR